MLWSILVLAVIALLAWSIRRATCGTPFQHCCPCTPYIGHLRWLEGREQKYKKEKLW